MEQIFRHDRKRGHTNWRSPFRLITASAVIHASGDGKWTVWHGSCDGCKPRAQCLGPNAGFDKEYRDGRELDFGLEPGGHGVLGV